MNTECWTHTDGTRYVLRVLGLLLASAVLGGTFVCDLTPPSSAPRHIVIVLDRSLSVNPGSAKAVDWAKEVGEQLVAHFGSEAAEKASYEVWFTPGDSPSQALSSRGARDLDLHEVAGLLRTVEPPDDRAPRQSPLRAAITDLEAQAPEAVLLLTDGFPRGEPRRDGEDPETALAEAIRRFPGADVRVSAWARCSSGALVGAGNPDWARFDSDRDRDENCRTEQPGAEEQHTQPPTPMQAPRSESSFVPLRRAAIADHRPVEAWEFESAALVGDPAAWRCSGVLVGHRVVLTARHCLPATRVAFARRDRDAREVYAVSSAEVHPNPRVDVALLRLAVDPRIEPESVPTSRDRPAPTGVVRVVGYGATDESGLSGFGTRHATDLPATGWGCTEDNATTEGCFPDWEMVLRSPIRDSCRGDSGGPVFQVWMNSAEAAAALGLEEGKRLCGWDTVAVVSRPTASSVRVCGDGGVYTRLDQLQPWLSKTVTRLDR